MLLYENRINTKNDLKNWIEYERKKYGGGDSKCNKRGFSNIRKGCS